MVYPSKSVAEKAEELVQAWHGLDEGLVEGVDGHEECGENVCVPTSIVCVEKG